MAIGLVERSEAPVAAADEHEPARRDDRAAEAAFGPRLIPHQPIRLQVVRGEHAAARHLRKRNRPVAMPHALELRRLEGLRIGDRDREVVDAADEEHDSSRGSYELGGQFTAICGRYTSGLSQNGVKILPPFTSSNPSGAMSTCCGTSGSPIGYGCVAAVFCRGSCGTGLSSMPMSGLPVSRSRM